MQDHREWHDLIRLLELTVRSLPDEGAMYTGQRTPGQTLGARSGDRCDASALGPRTRADAPASPDRRASIRHHQGVDGSYTLPDQDAEASDHRDESACTRLQPQARDEDPGHWHADRSNPAAEGPFWFAR